MRKLIDALEQNHSLKPEGYHRLLNCEDTGVVEYLHLRAREVTLPVFGNIIYLRGLIEISNCCRNDCFYCGIRKSNTGIKRYSLNEDQILDACRLGYDLGIRTFVLQAGENQETKDETITKIVANIRRAYPDCAITLSLGEKSRKTYENFFNAGANRYLLRHETYNQKHYQYLHPETMSLDNRLRCLDDLKTIGYQVGTGIMVGSPCQTIGNLVEDICFVEQFKPEMIGIGPFIPHKDTPFADYPAGNVELTLKLISIFRLMFPKALIPSTTSLNTVIQDGREKGILSGANVIMPNLTPVVERNKYELYNNKTINGAEAVEGLSILKDRMRAIGYQISGERGDYKKIK